MPRARPHPARAAVRGSRCASSPATATRSRSAPTRPCPGCPCRRTSTGPRRPARIPPSCTRRATGWRTRASSPTCSASTRCLARAGMVVLCHDPIGQGERRTRLAPARAARAAAGRVHVARRDGRRDDGRRSTCWRRATTSTPVGSPSPAPPAAASSRRSPRRSSIRASPRPASAASSTPTWPAARRRVRHRLGRLGRPLQPGAAPRRDRDDGPRAGRRRTARRDVVVHAVDDPPFPIAGARAVVAEAARAYAAAACRRRRAAGRAGRRPRPAPGDARRGGDGARRGARRCRRRRPRRRRRCSRRPGRSRTRSRAPATPQTTSRPAERAARRGAARPTSTRIAPLVGARARGGRVAARRTPQPDRAAVAAALGGRRPIRTSRRRVANHFGAPGRRLAASASSSRSRRAITLDAVLLLPDGWGDEVPGVLVIVDEGGKAVALARPGGRGRPRARLGGAGARPARHGRERGQRVRARDRGLAARPRPARRRASHDLRACRPAALGALLDGPAARQAAHRRARRRARSAWSRCSPRRSTTASPARSAAAFVAEPRGAAGREPAHHADGLPVPRAGDVGRARPGAPRRAAAAARRRRRGRRGGAGRRPAATSWRADARAVVHEVADRVWRCEQPDGPRRHPPGRDRGRRARAGGRHRPAGLARRRDPARPARRASALPPSCCSRTPTATTSAAPPRSSRGYPGARAHGRRRRRRR